MHKDVYLFLQTVANEKVCISTADSDCPYCVKGTEHPPTDNALKARELLKSFWETNSGYVEISRFGDDEIIGLHQSLRDLSYYTASDITINGVKLCEWVDAFNSERIRRHV